MAFTENGHPGGTAKLSWEDNGICGGGGGEGGRVHAREILIII